MLAEKHKGPGLINPSCASLRTDSKPSIHKQERRRVKDPFAPKLIKRGLLPSVRSCQKLLYPVSLELSTWNVSHFAGNDLCTILERVPYCWLTYLMLEVLSLCRLSAAGGDQDLIQACESLKHWALCLGNHDTQGRYTHSVWPTESTQLFRTIWVPIWLCGLRKSPSLSEIPIYLLK